MFIFYGEGLLASCPTSKLEAHPLSFFHGYSIYFQLPSIRNLTMRHAVVTETHLPDYYYYYYYYYY
jgi:hypothetical protein